MIDIQSVKQHVDLIELAGKSTQLRRISSSEYAGPCPLCGGDDRFHVKSDSWFCRKCQPEWRDAIDFVRWISPGLGFVEASSVPVGA